MLRRALQTIHADKRWWHAIGLGGLFSLTLFGHPLAAGLVVEHMDNTRKGYASPLPPFYDWTTRWLMGARLRHFFVAADFCQRAPRKRCGAFYEKHRTRVESTHVVARSVGGGGDGGAT